MMTRNSCGKRPCCICRKWFLPDVRQKGRQKTCNPDCKKELHRRQCKNWNKKNKAYFQNNYLGKKLEKAVDQETVSASRKTLLTHKTKPILPIEIITTEYGIKPAIIIQYLTAQIVNQTQCRSSGFP
jgi:hypothetical protein